MPDPAEQLFKGLLKFYFLRHGRGEIPSLGRLNQRLNLLWAECRAQFPETPAALLLQISEQLQSLPELLLERDVVVAVEYALVYCRGVRMTDEVLALVNRKGRLRANPHLETWHVGSLELDWPHQLRASLHGLAVTQDYPDYQVSLRVYDPHTGRTKRYRPAPEHEQILRNLHSAKQQSLIYPRPDRNTCQHCVAKTLCHWSCV